MSQWRHPCFEHSTPNDIMEANSMGEDHFVRVWTWEARCKLHGMCVRSSMNRSLESYLDIELECLRETMMQSWSGGWMGDVDDLSTFKDCMDALTSLRYSDPFDPLWLQTALPPWSRTKILVGMWTQRNVHTILGVLDFLDVVTARIPGKSLDWARVRQWVLQTWEQICTGSLSDLD